MEQLNEELFYIFVSQNQKKDVNMSKEESKCFDINNSRQKKHYIKWKNLINNIGDKVSENDKQNEKKEKTKTFEDFFPVETVTRFYVNRSDYKLSIEGA
jgi:hypothetical protein